MSDYIDFILPRIGHAVVAVGSVYLTFRLFKNEDLSPTLLEINRHPPAFVRQRVHRLVLCLLVGSGVSVVSTGVLVRLGPVLRVREASESLVSVAVVIGTGLLVERTQYDHHEGPGLRQLLWLLHCASFGLVIAPVVMEKSPPLPEVLLKQLLLVAVLGGTALAIPSDRHSLLGQWSLGGILLLMAASLGQSILPPQSLLATNLHAVSVYGGLLYFSASFLCDLQSSLARASSCGIDDDRCFDPFKCASRTLVDLAHLFIRLAGLAK